MDRELNLWLVGTSLCALTFGAPVEAADTLLWEDFVHSTFDPRWSVIETGDQSMRWFLVDSTFGTDNEGGGNDQTVIAFTQVDTTGYRDIFVRGRYRASNIATPFEQQDFFRIQGYESLPPSMGGAAIIENSTEGQWGGANQPPRTFIPLEASFGEYSWDNPNFWVAMEFNTSGSSERLFVEDFIVTGVPIPVISSDFNPVWTETFSNGVGRLSETRGDADRLITWNGTAVALDSRTYRTERVDQRYARVGPFSAAAGRIGFSGVVEPQSASGTAGIHAVIRLGFLNSAASNDENAFFVEFNSAGGGDDVVFLSMHADNGHVINESSGSIPFSFGEMYFVAAHADFRMRLATLQMFEGSDASGPLVGELEIPFPSDSNLVVDGLGLGNGHRLDPSNQSPMDVRVHEISLLAPRVGDFNGDNCINNIDLGILLASYLATENDAGFDARLDLFPTGGDGEINNLDLAVLLADYLVGCD